MHKVTYKSLILSFFILSAGTFMAWALGSRIIDEGKMKIFLSMIFSIPIIIFGFQALIYRDARRFLSAQLSFICSMGGSLTWLFVAFFLPIFWLSSINLYARIATFFYLILLFLSNIRLGKRNFERRWELSGKETFDHAFKKKSATVDWEKVTRAMKFQPEIFIFGIPEKWNTPVSLVLFVFLLIAANIRVIYPTLSMFMWSIPFSIVAAFFLQMTAYNFSQEKKILDIERELDVKISALD